MTPHGTEEKRPESARHYLAVGHSCCPHHHFGSFIFNISANLAARNIHSGFAFLHEQAGFEIGESLISFSSTEAYFKAFLVGLLNTIKVSVVSIITATVLGVIIGLMRLSKHPLLKFLGAAHVEFYRNIPLIVQLLLIYLIITELLPDSMEAVKFGSWGLLSKAGLQFAVPVLNGTACAWSFIAAGLAFFFTRPLFLKIYTGLISTVFRFRRPLLSEAPPGCASGSSADGPNRNCRDSLSKEELPSRRNFWRFGSA